MYKHSRAAQFCRAFQIKISLVWSPRSPFVPEKVQIDKNPGKYRARPPTPTPQGTPAPPGLGMGHSLHSASLSLRPPPSLRQSQGPGPEKAGSRKGKEKAPLTSQNCVGREEKGLDLGVTGSNKSGVKMMKSQ